MRSSNSACVVSLSFEGDRLRGGTTPSTGAPTPLDQQLDARPFEWNIFGLALSALPLEPGYRATMPVYMDRFGRGVWYEVEVVRDTSIVRANGHRAPMWEVLATADSVARPLDSGYRSGPGSWIRCSSRSRASPSCTRGRRPRRSAW